MNIDLALLIDDMLLAVEGLDKNIYFQTWLNDFIPKSESKTQYSDFVSMTEIEYNKLVSVHGEDFTKRCIARLDNYKGSKGAKYKDDYRAILSWVVDSEKQKSAYTARGQPKDSIYKTSMSKVSEPEKSPEEIEKSLEKWDKLGE